MCYNLWHNAPTMLPAGGRQHLIFQNNNRPGRTREIREVTLRAATYSIPSPLTCAIPTLHMSLQRLLNGRTKLPVRSTKDNRAYNVT